MKITRIVAPVRAQAVEAIRDEIIRGNLLPGQRLVERELCEQLDVSRNTIREACRQLEAEGFIEIPPHKGPVVSTISDRDARDLYEFREALECLAVRLFVERATQDAINDLHDSCTTLFAAHDSLDVAAMIDAKNHFYEIIYAGTENKVVGAQAKLLNGRLAGLRAQSLSQPGRPARSKNEIKDVLLAIEARDAAAAADLWRQHIGNAARTALNDPQTTPDSL
ncbi:GntR family transcriptional regulator [Mycolicibacterium fluoranthenivorans]|uniref:DNA-binding GntR family transcriptional regulator n=1 Tax=Mycolicibacterium fluoranthenivorans TaxID=258505 RepID=A0A7X5ZCD2_9MYCO|nr:GntR family transcriptional regulator [Mycolicibacterium fluoranthenivorans]MCV7355889.1 GntR family transcriptional regulator [Mycolicibacterium fluoranthenivorans]NIH94888.1 DNA-binding GntR family transcriptional regulator [Mycolicibacterium fluoranthenivorans]